jgi:hypothetical protein
MRRSPARRIATAVMAATLLIPGTLAAQETDPCQDETDPAYGSYDCKVSRLRERSFVVVAVVDSGINPYHLDFRLAPDDDMQGVPPWEYIEGYPEGTPALDLSLDAETYDEAWAEDQPVWSSAQWNTMYHIPGTKIIGGFGTGVGAYSDNPPIHGNHYHGTAAASVATGMIHGSAADADVLLVSVHGLGTQNLEWAASQPWIDLVSNSWGKVANIYFPSEEGAVSKQAVEEGRIITFAAGNGLSGTALACDRGVTTTSPNAGPAEVVTVGAVSPENEQAHCWHSIPPDVSSYGSNWPAAEYRSMDAERSFGGTSNATPLTSGVMAMQILEARRAFGDTVEGPHAGGNLAVAGEGAVLPETGPLADGVLHRQEVEDVVLKTAEPEEFDPDACAADPVPCANTTPTTPAYYVYMGYGIVNEASKGRALDVLFGRAPMPDRSDVDQWMEVKETVHGTAWSILP